MAEPELEVMRSSVRKTIVHPPRTNIIICLKSGNPLQFPVRFSRGVHLLISVEQDYCTVRRRILQVLRTAEKRVPSDAPVAHNSKS